MDITRDRFPVEVVKIIQDIAESHFVAIDLEFSGVAGRTQRTTGKPSLQELYDETKAAAEKYQVVQIGLTVVKEDTVKGRYAMHPYNFNISPLPSLAERTFRRDWTMSSGAISFLMRNKFDFGQVLTHGIPYLSRDEAKQVRSTLLGENTVKNADMELKSDDDALLKHIRHLLAEWVKQPAHTRESYLNIPSEDNRGKGVPGVLNKYQMRLTHQVVQNEFPGMKTASMRQFVQVIDPTHAESKASAAFQAKEAEKEVSRATGFRWLLEALVGGDISQMPDNYLLAGLPRDIKPQESESALKTFANELNEKLRKRRRVLVGHNCFTDLIYLLYFFDGHLPSQIRDFQDRVHELFPAVIDTKKLASFGTGRWRDTSLEFVEEEMRFEPLPTIVIPPEFDRYLGKEMQHEAGYDSLLTAKIAVKLPVKLEREGLYLEEATKSDIQTSDQFGEPQGYVTADQSVDDLKLNKIDDVQETNDQDLLEFSLKTTDQTFSDPTTPKIPQPMPVAASETLIVTPTQNTVTKSVEADSFDLVAVKEKKSRAVSWSKPAEVERVKSSFANSTIYDVLNGTEKEEIDEAGYEADSDLMSFSDTELSAGKEVAADETLESIDVMVKNGQLMPRWDKGIFWTEFGNKLQVNSCKEETCEF